MLWPDTMSLAGDGYLYFTANQLHRQPSYHNGRGPAGQTLQPVPHTS